MDNNQFYISNSCSDDMYELDSDFEVKSVKTGVSPKGSFGDKPTFADLTTMCVGGSIANYVEVETELDFINAVKQADEKGEKLLVIGAGSNIVGSEENFDGSVIRDVRTGIKVIDNSACGGVSVEVVAGHPWDEFVAFTVSKGWVGLECLSGIPGTVGASPVQNIGAYGVEVQQFISKVITYDRVTKSQRTFTNSELEFAYRSSILKTSRKENNPYTGLAFGATGRYIVLKVEFQFRHASDSLPIKYKELAQYLGVNVGDRAESTKVRDAVISIRTSKGTCLNSEDVNTRSSGSYFLNPIVSCETAEKLGESAPVFDVTDYASASQIDSAGKTVAGLKKVSAAWLIQNAGFAKGYGDNKGASLSDYHVLILVNRGEATSTDIRELADEIISKVRNRYGITLEPEPVYV